MRRRAVRHGHGFLERARALFPPGGSADGAPSFELFEATILQTATLAFANNFEACASDMGPDSPVRMVLTADTVAFWRPVVFYGLLVDDDTVEIVDLAVDDRYDPSSGDPDL